MTAMTASQDVHPWVAERRGRVGFGVEVFPIETEDVIRASAIVRTSRLSARDGIHEAVMQRRGISTILSFDRAFDDVPGIIRRHG